MQFLPSFPLLRQLEFSKSQPLLKPKHQLLQKISQLPNQKLQEPLKKFQEPQLVNKPKLLSKQLIQEMIKLNQQSLIKLEELSNPKREIKFQFTTQILFHQLVLQLDLLKLSNKRMRPLLNLLPQQSANRLPEPQLRSQQELIPQHQLLKRKMIKKKKRLRPKIKQRKRRKMLKIRKRMLKMRKLNQNQRKMRRKRMITLLKEKTKPLLREKIKPLPVMKRKLKLKLMPKLKHQKLMMPRKRHQKPMLPKLMPHQKLMLPQKLKPKPKQLQRKLLKVSTQRLDFQTDPPGKLILKINKYLRIYIKIIIYPT